MRVSCMTTAAVALLGMSYSVNAVTVTFKNSCSYKIDLYAREGGSKSDGTSSISPGATNQKQFGKDFEGHFRHGQDDAATLIEFSTKGSMNFVWYDISVIPPRLNKGFEFCKSLDECKTNSQSKKGFNVPIQMSPASNTNGNQCRELTCLADGCPDAYLFPQDDTKTHACNLDTNFVVTFCPNGSGGGNATEPSTSAPSPTTAAPQTTAPAQKTPAPTTAVKPASITFEQTTAPPTAAPTSAPAVTLAPTPAPTPAPVPTQTSTPEPSANGKIRVPDVDNIVVITPPPTPSQTPAPTAAPTQAPATVATPVASKTISMADLVPTPAPTPKKLKKKNIKHCE